MYVVGFVAGEKPFKTPVANKQEFINEVMVQLAAYPLFVFTDWIVIEEQKF